MIKYFIFRVNPKMLLLDVAISCEPVVSLDEIFPLKLRVSPQKGRGSKGKKALHLVIDVTCKGSAAGSETGKSCMKPFIYIQLNANSYGWFFG